VATKTGYDGYRSFQYLVPDEDYQEFELAPESGRVDSLVHPTSAAEEARVQRLLAESLVISLHDHVSVLPADIEGLNAYRQQGREWLGYEGLSRSSMDAVIDAPMLGASQVNSRIGWKWDDAVWEIGMRLSDIAHQRFVIRGESCDDILRAREEGRIALVLSLEAATPIENEIDRLDVLYGLGVRMAGICYSQSNQLGGGLAERTDSGLTDLGRAAVQRMNRLGMAIDLSHAGDQTSLDAISASDRPVFFTHTGARALWDSPRLKPDPVLRACAERGGVIGIEAAPMSTITRDQRRHTLDTFMCHFEHVAEVVGIDHVAFGPDTTFGDHVAMGRYYGRTLGRYLGRQAAEAGTPSTPRPEAIQFVEGVENPGEQFANIVRWLVTHGYSDGDIGKVLGGNALRALGQAWA
jgi:membrane dipeptidase